MGRREARLFKVVTLVSIVLITAYFVVSIGYTARNTPVNSSTKEVQLDVKGATGRLDDSVPPDVLHYSAVVTDYGSSVFIPHAGIEKIEYDRSVISVEPIPAGDGTVFEVTPKKFFTRTDVRVEFKDGVTALIELTGSFTSSIELTASADKITGVAGETLNVSIGVANTGIKPFTGELKVDSTPNIEVKPPELEIAVGSNSLENITLHVALKSPGYGGINVEAGGKTLFIPVRIEPPFTVENFTKTVPPGGDVKIVVSKNKACRITVGYGSEVLYADASPTEGTETIEVRPPVENVPAIPLTVSGCGYTENLFVNVETVKKPPQPSVEVVPVGKMVFVPGTYELIVRNDGLTPVNVSITTEHGDEVSVTSPGNVLIPGKSFKVITFNITVKRFFTGSRVMTITVSYGSKKINTTVTLVPSTSPEFNVSIRPVVGLDGITSVRITIEPNSPVSDATIRYSVRVLYNGTFVPVVSSDVSIGTLEKTEVILPQFAPASVVLVSLEIDAGGKVLYRVSKTLIFKRLDR